MVDTLCTVMGSLDIIAGILIILGFGNHLLIIMFGILIIGKGAISFA